MTLIKSISGIRGTVGGPVADNLTPPDVVRFTTAYAQWVKQQQPSTTRCRVVVGRDARLSGEMVNALVVGTLLGCGIDVLDIGLATTPTTEMAVQMEQAQGGIIITASHNPRQWNALKLLNAQGEFLTDADGRVVLALADDGVQATFASVDELGVVEHDASFLQRHIERILVLPYVDREAIARARFKVAIDCVNSVGGIALPPLLMLREGALWLLLPPMLRVGALLLRLKFPLLLLLPMLREGVLRLKFPLLLRLKLPDVLLLRLKFSLCERP